MRRDYGRPTPTKVGKVGTHHQRSSPGMQLRLFRTIFAFAQIFFVQTGIQSWLEGHQKCVFQVFLGGVSDSFHMQREPLVDLDGIFLFQIAAPRPDFCFKDFQNPGGDGLTAACPKSNGAVLRVDPHKREKRCSREFNPSRFCGEQPRCLDKWILSRSSTLNTGVAERARVQHKEDVRGKERGVSPGLVQGG